MSRSAFVVVLVTAPDAETGEAIGRTLVEERLAACVNVVPGVRSVYRWQGRVLAEAEVLLVIKTRKARFEELERRVRELHPYDVPEVVGVGVEAVSSDYGRFIEENVE